MKAILRRGFLALAIMLALAVPAHAGPFVDGLVAYYTDDYAKALRILRPLAEQGDIRAQTLLGNIYAEGKGVPEDYAEAVKWYRKAAEQGDAGAVKWFRKAAEQGYAGAQYNLGTMYGNGEGVPKDSVLAYMWLNLAAAQGLKDAQKGRGLVAEEMTPDQIAEAQRMAREWMAKHQQ